jgi:hypothetical protein
MNGNFSRGRLQMPAGEMEQLARIAAIIAGILFGSLALSSVIWVWTKKQIYAYGGSALSVVGIILMGLSIYKTVDVKAAPDGIGIKLAEMERALKEQTQAAADLQTKLASLPSGLETKFTQLNKAVSDQAAAQAARFDRIEAANSVQILNAASTGKTGFDKSSFVYNWPTKMKYADPDLIGVWGPIEIKGVAASGTPISINANADNTAISLRQKINEFSKSGVLNAQSSGIPTALIRLGDLYVREGRFQEAEQSYREGLKILQREKGNLPEPEKK